MTFPREIAVGIRPEEHDQAGDIVGTGHSTGRGSGGEHVGHGVGEVRAAFGESEPGREGIDQDVVPAALPRETARETVQAQSSQMTGAPAKHATSVTTER